MRLLPFPPRRRDGSSETIFDDVVAEIDLKAGRRNPKPESSRGKDSGLEAGERTGQGSAASSEGLARGLSWAACGHTAAAATAGATAKAMGICRTKCGSRVAGRMERGGGDRNSGGGKRERRNHGVGSSDGGTDNAGGGDSGGDDTEVGGSEDGDKVCHIAVACGPEVLLWRVSRVSCRERPSSAAGAGGEGGAKYRRYYRYSAIQVRTDWHASGGTDDRDGGGRGGGNSGNMSVNQALGGDGMSSKARTPAPAKVRDNSEGQDPSLLVGNVRCLSFRPCAGGSVGGPTVTGSGDAAIPLAAWYDSGATVLG